METVLLAAFGLAGASGLNAWLPALVIAISSRAGGIDLTDPYDQIASDPGLAILTAGFLFDFVADKIPAVDSIAHAIGTVVHPVAGAVVAASQTGADIPAPVLLLAGALTAEAIHAGRATIRPVATALTGGVANPFLSLFEDCGALGVALFVLVAPIVAALLVLLLLVAIAISIVYAKRLRDRRRAAHAAIG
jgi:hypothetical protein